jgi:hypothetical protein
MERCSHSIEGQNATASDDQLERLWAGDACGYGVVDGCWRQEPLIQRETHINHDRVGTKNSIRWRRANSRFAATTPFFWELPYKTHRQTRFSRCCPSFHPLYARAISSIFLRKSSFVVFTFASFCALNPTFKPC